MQYCNIICSDIIIIIIAVIIITGTLIKKKSIVDIKALCTEANI